MTKKLAACALMGAYMGFLIFVIWCIGEAIARWPWLMAGVVIGFTAGAFALVSAMGASSFSEEIRSGHIYGEE